MAIRTLQARQAEAAAYAAQALYAFMCQGDPGTGSTVANEAAGGSPAYARKALTWSAPDINAQVTATVTFDVPAGTYTYAGVATTASGATQFDSGAIASVTYASQAQHTLTLTFRAA